MDPTGANVPKMAKPRLRLTTSTKSATYLHSQTCEGEVGHLASLAYHHIEFCLPRSGMDNIIAALEHNNRIYQVKLYNLPSSLMESMLAAMQKPFTALTSL